MDHTSSARSERLRKFVEWLKANGAIFPKVEIRDGTSEGGSGVYALEHIESDERYAFIPHDLIITGKVCHDTVRTNGQQQQQQEGEGDDPRHRRMMLSIFLIHERFVMKETSFWKPYIDILPLEFHTPLQFNDEELKFLCGTPAEFAVEERRKGYREQHRTALALVPESVIPRDVLTYENYLWAMTVLSSRSFSKDLMEGSLCSLTAESEVLMPLLDMTNHYPLTPVTWTICDDGVGFSNCGTIEAGQEIVNDYGEKSNEELMMGYGFCVPQNPLSCFHIKLNYSQDPLVEAKERILAAAGLEKSHDQYIRASELPCDLLPVLRVMVMTDVDLYYIGQDADRDLLEHVGLRNELRARFLLMFLLEKKLSVFESSVAGLPAEATTTNAQVAFAYRTEIEDILRSTIANLQTAEQDIMARACRLFESEGHELPRYICAEKPEKAATGPTSKRARADVRPSEQFIDSVLITSESFATDQAFLEASELVDVNEDILLTLFLLRARMVPSSPWHAAIRRLDGFKHPMLLLEQNTGDMYGEMLAEIGEMHDSLFPLLTEHFGDVFPAEHFTVDKFLWASGIVEAFRVIVPPRCTSGDCEVEGICLI
ncbi:hypothetical protein GGH94_001184 [Coemansia aciculifera]|uniref:Rubisco LSMT substrate-binding domain-containing protein n=1 Tax=Coemansia aciculifera TaxID=417176 RepID=A0A9W8IV90_9FUNG|nr:hypothetical protein GGH94_001184 [Coemansia aciculifera]KAJ2876271.1 hypothetical protein GGH93_000928 [Coemansia aciculifera]